MKDCIKDYFQLLNNYFPDQPIEYEKIIARLPDSSKLEPWQIAYVLLNKNLRIDWESYLNLYEDVLTSGIDPCLHFVKYGLYEGRQLCSIHPMATVRHADQPSVSVLISNYNNEIFLEKSIMSALGQSLKNIEVIVIDDASTDGSRAILESLSKKDSRLKIIYNIDNKGTFITRKQAVNAASGRYIMFLDADDYLNHRACEIAFTHIRKGYDIVKFGANIFNADYNDTDRVNKFNNYINRSISKRYFTGHDIFEAIFLNSEISWNLWDKIYLREICVAAYSDVPEGYYLRSEDRLGTVAIASRARSLYVITHKLYNHNFGIGGSSTRSKASNLKNLLNFCTTAKATIQFIRSKGLDPKFESLAVSTLHYVLQLWAKVVPDHDAGKYLDRIIAELGQENVIKAFIDILPRHAESILSQLAHIKTPVHSSLDEIILLNYEITREQIISFIAPLYHWATSKHLSLRILTSKFPKDADLLPENLRLEFVRAPAETKEKLLGHCLSLLNALKVSPNPLVIAEYDQSSPWIYDLAILKSIKIPSILKCNKGFAELSEEKGGLCAFLRLCACFGQIMTWDSQTTLLLETNRIKTHKLYPVTESCSSVAHSFVPDAISILIDKKDTTATLEQYVLICRELVKKRHYIKIYIIGEPANNNLRKFLFGQIRRFQLGANVVVVGEVSDPASYLTLTSCLLSIEAKVTFSHRIAFAQSCSLPCVVNDIPSDQLRSNPSILTFSAGHPGEAVDAILRIINNFFQWSLLASTAHFHSLCYSSREFAQDMDAASGLAKPAVKADYSPDKFEKFIRNLTIFCNY